MCSEAALFKFGSDKKRLPGFSSLREFFDFQMQYVPGFFGDAERVPDPISRHPDDLLPRADQRPLRACPPGHFDIGIKILHFDGLPAHAKRSENIPGAARADHQAVSRQPVSIQPGRPVVRVF